MDSKISFPRLSPFQTIIAGFAGVILLGSILLMLPVSSADHTWTPFINCLFTATSSTCVTGLVVYDTATHWSVFGQIILLILIQMGGMGVVTVATSLAMLTGKKLGLAQRNTMQESVAAPQMGGVLKYTLFIVKYIFILEGIGALLLMPVMIRDFGAVKGIYYAIFHSISAFCNAGFDLMGVNGEFSSLTGYSSDIYFNVVIMSLIIVGGIGFLTWKDVREHGIHLKKYRMQSKVILVTTLILLVLPAVFFYFHEFTSSNWSSLSGTQKVLASLFTSVTARTAGFNTIDMGSLSGSSKTIMIVLMLIGGSTGSTAGGMKTTTIAVLILSMIAVFRRREYTTAFGRRIPSATVKNAFAIFAMYIFIFLCGAVIINCADGLDMGDCLFEAASAMGTVGVTAGITTSLGTLSKIVIMIIMFWGRMGGLTLIYAAMSSKEVLKYKLPESNINVG
ncbi:MAG: Trk family potassium uptake protein [Lachnospiraceae bacterium]|nr:Trk family potassium uptake protein [Lachnospiraceae bacterium]